MLAEERLDLAVESSQLGPGEQVIVVSKSGNEVARGCVREVFLDGSVWIESAEDPKGVHAARVYPSELYSFVPLEPPAEAVRDPQDGPDVEPDEQLGPTLAELDVDRVARERMEDLGINLEAAEDDDEDEPKPRKKRGKKKSGKKKAAKKKPASTDPVDDEDEDDEGDDEPKAKSPAGGGNGKSAESAASRPIGGSENARGIQTGVDIDSLPASVRERVSNFGELEDAKSDQVLSSISDSAVRALREAGIKDSEVYRYVVKIQDAVSRVLKAGGTKGSSRGK
jgi:hypothetical protein